MIKIFSPIDPDRLLHIVHSVSDSENTSERVEIAPADQFLQLCFLQTSEGRAFPAHKHLWKQSTNDSIIAQESWVVVRGKVEIRFYDLDNSYIATHILNPGDCSMTFEGGHAYKILEEDTVVYEYKTGPYQGQKLDKEFINED